MKIIGPALMLLGATACGPLAQDSTSAMFLSGLLTPKSSEPVAAADPRAGLSREAISRSDFELILLALVESDLTALAQFASRNGDRVTWATLDGVSVTFDEGIVVATRGLGDDLMGAYVSSVRNALRQGGGTAVRVNEYLDGLDQIQQLRFQCRIEAQGPETITIIERNFSTQHLVETCVMANQEIENHYWITGAGAVVQSRQWISPAVGYLDHQSLD